MTTRAVQAPAGAFPPAAAQAFARGDAATLARAFPTAEALARYAIEVRRSNVATLGAHEAFVRRTAAGDLRQIIRPVRLSTKDGTLYQIGGGTKKRPVDPETGLWIGKVEVKDWERANKKRVRWEEVEIPVDGPAILTFEGFQRCNEVVGASLVSPPTVVVDGEHRTNPYVERSTGDGGRLGDVRRIVISQAVVGYAPATGNPVVVNYTLDYDPAKDLSAMLARIADDHPEDCYLTTEEEAREERQGDRARTRWQYHPLYGGVGYWFDLRLEQVRRAYREFAQILAFGPRKAQTVCLRNALKRHPAFSRHHAVADDHGEAVIPVVGWTSEGDALEQVRRIAEAFRRGDTALDDAEAMVIDAASSYDPDGDPEEQERAAAALEAPKEEPGGSLLDQVAATRARREQQQPVTAGSPEHERNLLVERVSTGLGLLSPEQINRVGLPDDLSGVDADDLRAALRTINAVLDENQR